MHPFMMILMLAGGHTMMNAHGKHAEKVPTQVIDVRYQVCPVKGGKPRDDIASLRRNRVYHFCSTDCLETFKRNPRPILRKVANSPEVALRTTNPDGVDPVSRHKIDPRKNPPFLVRGNKITFYATPDTLGKDVEPPKTPASASEDHSQHASGHDNTGSDSGNHGGSGMMCH